MKAEIEAKFLEINKSELRKKLRAMGAKLIAAEHLMLRRNFDHTDNRLEKVGAWIRVRKEFDKTTMSFKQLKSRTVHGMKEINLTVNDFEDASKLLIAAGLSAKSYQETKRESWKLSGVEIEIDTWPWVPPFVELEGKSAKKVKEVAEKLGFEWSSALFGSVEIVYQKYYDVTEQEVDSWPIIKFSKVPNFLKHKKI